MSGASVASTRASATRARSPPESVVTGRLGVGCRSRSPPWPRDRSAVGVGQVGAARRAAAGRARRCRRPPAASGRRGPAAGRRSAGHARRATVVPERDRRRSEISPLAGTRPAIARSSVVLPAPFGPTIDDELAAADDEVDAGEDRAAARSDTSTVRAVTSGAGRRSCRVSGQIVAAAHDERR